VCVLNGLFLFEAIALQVCRERSIQSFVYERGFIPGTIITHRDNADYLLDVSQWWGEASERPLGSAEDERLDVYLDDRRHGRRTMDQYWSKDTLHDAVGSNGQGRLAVLFTNLTWDSAVLGQEVAFPSIQAWLVASIEWFAAHPEHRLVVRIHPAEQKLAGKQTREPLGEFIADRFRQLPSNIEVLAANDPTSSYGLMDACDFGLVFTSTTGLELALNGKPVVVAGNTHYRGKGFTVDVKSAEDFDVALERLSASTRYFRPDIERVRRYANLFFFDAPITIPGVAEPVIGLVRLDLDDVSQLAPGVNPEIDRLCDFILERR
jgi:capsule polysaccharide modification protein KpsS